MPSPAPRSDAGQHKKQETTNSDLKAIDPEEIGLDLDLDPGGLESVIPIESRVDEQPPPPPKGRLPLQPTPPIGSPKKLSALDEVPSSPRSDAGQHQEQGKTTPSTASVGSEEPQPPVVPGYWGWSDHPPGLILDLMMEWWVQRNPNPQQSPQLDDQHRQKLENAFARHRQKVDNDQSPRNLHRQ